MLWIIWLVSSIHLFWAGVIFFDPDIAVTQSTIVEAHELFGGPLSQTGILYGIISLIALFGLWINGKHPLASLIFMVPQQFILFWVVYGLSDRPNYMGFGNTILLAGWHTVALWHHYGAELRRMNLWAKV